MSLSREVIGYITRYFWRKVDNINLQSGQSIKFGDGTALSQYVEGTWTPDLRGLNTAGTTTYSVQAGKYTRIGNVVFVNASINISTISGGVGFAIIDGLPYTIADIDNKNYMSTFVYAVNYSDSATDIRCYFPPGYDYLYVGYEMQDNTLPTVMSITDFSANDQVRVTGWYWTDD